MAIEQNVLRSCVALKLITNGLDMAHDMREQRRGATEPARQHEEGTTVRQSWTDLASSPTVEERGRRRFQAREHSVQ